MLEVRLEGDRSKPEVRQVGLRAAGEEPLRERQSTADWRARFGAKEAELRAYRELGSVPWYRRLLPSPVRKEITGLPNLALEAK